MPKKQIVLYITKHTDVWGNTEYILKNNWTSSTKEISKKEVDIAMSIPKGEKNPSLQAITEEIRLILYWGLKEADLVPEQEIEFRIDFNREYSFTGQIGCYIHNRMFSWMEKDYGFFNGDKGRKFIEPLEPEEIRFFSRALFRTELESIATN